jgi:hypothetical protein
MKDTLRLLSELKENEEDIDKINKFIDQLNIDYEKNKNDLISVLDPSLLEKNEEKKLISIKYYILYKRKSTSNIEQLNKLHIKLEQVLDLHASIKIYKKNKDIANEVIEELNRIKESKMALGSKKEDCNYLDSLIKNINDSSNSPKKIDLFKEILKKGFEVIDNNIVGMADSFVAKLDPDFNANIDIRIIKADDKSNIKNCSDELKKIYDKGFKIDGSHYKNMNKYRTEESFDSMLKEYKNYKQEVVTVIEDTNKVLSTAVKNQKWWSDFYNGAVKYLGFIPGIGSALTTKAETSKKAVESLEAKQTYIKSQRLS